MTISTENVGSLPRPARLQSAIAAYDAGQISFDDLAKEQDDASTTGTTGSCPG